MFSKSLLYFITLWILVNGHSKLTLVKKARSKPLSKYLSFFDAIAYELEVPEDTFFACFKFVTIEVALSLLECKARAVSLDLKYGSLPVINPDGVPFPPQFKYINRPTIHHIDFKSDRSEHYINITSPKPGSYYVVSYLSYVDPRKEVITQQGLTPECLAKTETTLYVAKVEPVIITHKGSFEIKSDEPNSIVFYKFIVPNPVNLLLLDVPEIQLQGSSQVLITFGHSTPQYEKMLVEDNFSSKSGFFVENLEYTYVLDANKSSVTITKLVKDEPLFYIEIKMTNFKGPFRFNLKSYLERPILEIGSDPFDKHKGALWKINEDADVTTTGYYSQYNLVKASGLGSFNFTYNFDYTIDNPSTIPTPLNLSSNSFSVLKFSISKITETGGTLQFGIAFTKKVKIGDHYVIGCINLHSYQTPVWPDGCQGHTVSNSAIVNINKNLYKASMLIPYPEKGTWYVSLKLFCGKCIPCTCSKRCNEIYKDCYKSCHRACQSSTQCDCAFGCRQKLLKEFNCSNCDCDGPCIRTKEICYNSVIYNISSYPCILGQCGKNGKCMYLIAGFGFSLCKCFHKYAGWDCSHNSRAIPFIIVLVGWILLIVSNFVFIPAAYFAYVRKYYTEALVYACVSIFSTLYHACDADDNLLRYCIANMNSLQFADFFCAILSVWVTLIAIADLTPTLNHLAHMMGAIGIAFVTFLQRTSLWAFAIPILVGILCIVVSWIFKYRQMRQLFLDRIYAYVYLPLGLTLVTIGGAIFVGLQTKQNYPYLHSMWHTIMGITVICILPRPNSFFVSSCALT